MFCHQYSTHIVWPNSQIYFPSLSLFLIFESVCSVLSTWAQIYNLCSVYICVCMIWEFLASLSSGKWQLLAIICQEQMIKTKRNFFILLLIGKLTLAEKSLNEGEKKSITILTLLDPWFLLLKWSEKSFKNVQKEHIYIYSQA